MEVQLDIQIDLANCPIHETKRKQISLLSGVQSEKCFVYGYTLFTMYNFQYRTFTLYNAQIQDESPEARNGIK